MVQIRPPQPIKKADAKASELENLAYERFNDETEKLYSLYGILSDKENSEKKLAADSIEDFRNLAFKAADLGDYSLLEEIGIDTSKLKGDEEWKMAELLAKYGDYSGLQALGVDTSRLTDKEKQELAELFAKYGDYSALRALGVNTDNRELEEYYDRLLKKQKVW